MTKIEKIKNIIALANISAYYYRTTRQHNGIRKFYYCVVTKQDISELFDAAGLTYEKDWIINNDEILSAKDYKRYPFLIEDEKEIPEAFMNFNNFKNLIKFMCDE